MEYTITIFLYGLVFLCDRSQSFQTQDSAVSGLEDGEAGSQEGQGRQLDLHSSEDQPLNLLDNLSSMGQARDPILFKLLGQALRYRSLSDLEVAEFLSDMAGRVSLRQPVVSKRTWSRVNVQPRFAPFGTKLVPSRKLENNGATLLRYGRSI
ncbi:hypothetical protein Btru_069701 [Bulinus truncatus]|nr:hypothetical protein Btru_069701 [Bulinus truncatus]